ncbi:hypothetical protein AMK59_5149, partial [Oryctes borbonicus]
MIKLNNFYDCENAVFLILQYCCGSKLLNYIQQMYSANGNSFDINGEYMESDNDSEGSYSDLINEYAASKLQTSKTNITGNNFDKNITKISADFGKTSIEKDTSNNLEIDGMLMKSQQLLSTIEEALTKVPESASLPLQIVDSEIVKADDVFERKLSDRSVHD